MAKVLLSALLDGLTGKLSGSVFQNSVGGLQLRSRVSPRDPKSTPQQRTRSVESYNRFSWSSLSTADQDSWRDNAPADVPGISFNLATQQKIATAGLPAIATYIPGAPMTFFLMEFADLSPGLIRVQAETPAGVLPAGWCVNIFVSPPMSPGTLFITPSAHKFIYSVPPGTDTNNLVDITAAYIAMYRALVVDEIVGLKAYIIDTVNGPASVDYFNYQQAS